MTSHKDYVADQDEEQLRHLITEARARLDELSQGKWVWLWVVAGSVKEGWFEDSNYAGAVALLERLGKQAIDQNKREELSLERQQYRAVEAARLVLHTQTGQA